MSQSGEVDETAPKGPDTPTADWKASPDHKSNLKDDNLILKEEEEEADKTENENIDSEKPFPKLVEEEVRLAFSQQEAITVVDPTDQPHPPLKHKFLFIVVFVTIGLGEGMFLGYVSSLMASLTELKVPSEKRSLLAFLTVVYIFRMFLAPLADRYFSLGLGKRKSYIVPAKLLSALLYLIVSFFIEDWIEALNIVPIFFCLLGIGVTMILESNALGGLRMDFFGKQNASSASVTQHLGFLFGMMLALQVFTSLSSEYVCKDILGMKGPIWTHTGFFRIISAVNFFGVCLVFLIREQDPTPDSLAKIKVTPFKVIQGVLKVKRLKKIILWNLFGPTLCFGMKLIVNQYYIKKGFKREDYILCSFMVIPVGAISNVLWIKVLKSGNFMTKLWISVLISGFVECLHIFNYSRFDPEKNYRSTLIGILIIKALDIPANWITVQIALLLTSASKLYTVTFLTTLSSVLTASRAPSITLMSSVVDYVPMQVLYALGCLGQLTFNILTWKMVREIDLGGDLQNIGEEFDRFVSGPLSEDYVGMDAIDDLDYRGGGKEQAAGLKSKNTQEFEKVDMFNEEKGSGSISTEIEQDSN